jgi:hypothetical protein
MADAVRQVGTDGGRDAGAQAPLRQRWRRLVASAGVQQQHACGKNQAIHRERDQASGQARLAVRADQLVSVAVGDHRSHCGDRGDRQGRGYPDQTIGHAGL